MIALSTDVILHCYAGPTYLPADHSLRNEKSRGHNAVTYLRRIFPTDRRCPYVFTLRTADEYRYLGLH